MSHFVLPQGRRSQKQEFAGKSMGESVIQSMQSSLLCLLF